MLFAFRFPLSSIRKRPRGGNQTPIPQRVPTFYGILGLILGSLVSMFINSDIYPKYISGSIQTWDYIIGAVLFVLGAVGVLFLIRLAKKKKPMPVEGE